MVAEAIQAGKEQGGAEEELWCTVEDEYYPPCNWREEWEHSSPENHRDRVRWVRMQPPLVRELASRYPPQCLVRALVDLKCPLAGRVAIVSSYRPPVPEHPGGKLSLLSHPNARRQFLCNPTDVEVVGFYRGLTREVFAELLRRQTR
jgi:hypothetical protein